MELPADFLSLGRGSVNGYLNSEMYSVMRYSKAILHCP